VLGGEGSPGELRSPPQPAGAISLLSAFPELARHIGRRDREVAERVRLACVPLTGDEDLAEKLAAWANNVFELLIVAGVVIKETTLAGRSALELLGPGDVLAPPLSAIHQVESRALSRYRAHGRVSLAALDERFEQAIRRWPALARVLCERLGRQTHRASMHLAMVHLPRVEDRLTALFADLGERFGRMTPEGVVIELKLTHEVIGRLVGSRRPTVSIALRTLAEHDVLVRLDDNTWRVARAALGVWSAQGESSGA
jgi:CRP/FNR family cyclic AMP-dependent transcriptional regulator